MIRPKHSFGKKNFEIQEVFIDRVEAKKLYKSKMESNEKKYNILVFYGVGGIGKSKLRKEISRIHNKEYNDSIIMYLDLNAADDRNIGSGILKLVDSCSKKVDFKCFELAYALYFRKKYPSSSYGREKAYLTEKTTVGIGLNILGILDSGITTTATEIVEKTIRAISNRTINKEVKEELKRFDEYSLPEMEERLPLFFQYDLLSHLSKKKESKILIIFDTFEAINENIIEQIHKAKNERWVQDIISYFDSEQFPNLLFMIFGREPIEWDTEWMPLLEQYQIKEFEENYSREYLTSVGIDNESIIKAIITSCKGYPFLLYLSTETYAQIINTGNSPQEKDFKGNYPEIIERFLYNLDKDTVEVLRILSIPNFYNTDIFSNLISEFNISFPMTQFEQFNKYSFISSDERSKDLYIHDLMRKCILEKTSEDVKRSAHNKLQEYYLKKTLEGNNTKSFIELIYHVRNHCDYKEFNEWLKSELSSDEMTPLNIFKGMQKKGEQSILKQIIDGVLSTYKLSDLLIDFVNIYIDVVHLGGEYETAVDICKKYLQKYNDDEIFKNKQLLKMRIRKIHHSMFFMPVDALIEECETIINGIEKNEYPEEYNEILFLLGGNLGILSGRFDYSKNWLENSMRYAKELNLDSFVFRTTRKLADVYLYHDNYQKALEIVSSIVSEDNTLEEIDDRYKIYLMGVLGEIYRKIGDLEKAKVCYEKVEKKSIENYLPGWQAHSYLALGLVAYKEKKITDAHYWFNKANMLYTKINQAWGKINLATAELLLNKAEIGYLEIEKAVNIKLYAERMNYRYNFEYLNSLINDNEEYFELFFL